MEADLEEKLNLNKEDEENVNINNEDGSAVSTNLDDWLFKLWLIITGQKEKEKEEEQKEECRWREFRLSDRVIVWWGCLGETNSANWFFEATN